MTKEVCDVLGLIKFKGSHTNNLKHLNKDEKRVVSRNSIPKFDLGILIVKPVNTMSLISESGLYKLILRSEKPNAKPFQDWVTRDVLPAIRKDGIRHRRGKSVLPHDKGV